MNIYVSNLNSSVSDEELKNLFSSYGEVQSAKIVLDVFTGVSRGFAFVEMSDDAAAQKAIEGLNKSVLHELVISVEQAVPKNVQKGSYKVGNGPVNAYRFGKN